MPGARALALFCAALTKARGACTGRDALAAVPSSSAFATWRGPRPGRGSARGQRLVPGARAVVPAPSEAAESTRSREATHLLATLGVLRQAAGTEHDRGHSGHDCGMFDASTESPLVSRGWLPRLFH